MQQTEVYKLNLIETTDPFSPAPLNENTEKLETALSTETSALDARVTALEAKYFVFGTYTGNGASSQFVELGFKPRAVIAHNYYIQYYSAFALDTQPAMGTITKVLEIAENGFYARNDSSAQSRDMNENGRHYNFIAFA